MTALGTILSTSEVLIDGGFTPGAMVYADASGNLVEDAALTYDGANNKLTVDSLAVGYLGTAGFFGVAHSSNANSTDYGLIQTSTGGTAINAKSGQVVSVAIGGAARATWALSLLTLASGYNVATNTGTGTIVATTVSQKLGFHGATAVVQRAGATQAAVATTGAINLTPFGYTTAAQADAIVTLVNEIRATLVEKGIMKGAA